MKKTTIIVMFVTVISKILGFIRDVTLTSLFGFKSITDAFQSAISIPNMVITVVAAAFITGVIPMLTRISRDDKERADRFTSNIFNIMCLIASVLLLFMLIFPELSVQVLGGGGGFNNETLAIASMFVRVIAFSVFSVIIIQLGTGYLNVKGSFVGPASLTIPVNIILITGIYLASLTQNTALLIFSQLIAIVIQSLFIYYFMKKRGFKYTLHVDFTDEDLRLMLKLSLPLVLSSALGQVNEIMMKTFATWFYEGEGAYSMMNAVTKLIGFIQGVFITTILNVTYPSVAKKVVENDEKGVLESFNEAVIMISIFVLPAMAGFLTLPNEIVSFVYERGMVDTGAIEVIVPIFICYTFVIFSQAIRELLNRLHYAYQDMMSTVINSAVFTVLFVILMYVMGSLFKSQGQSLAALAAAYAIAMAVMVVPLYFSLKKHVKSLTIREILPDFSKILGASLVMGAVILLIKTPVTGMFSPTVSLILLIGLGVVVYMVLVLLLRLEFVKDLLGSLKLRRK